MEQCLDEAADGESWPGQARPVSCGAAHQQARGQTLCTTLRCQPRQTLRIGRARSGIPKAGRRDTQVLRILQSPKITPSPPRGWILRQAEAPPGGQHPLEKVIASVRAQRRTRGHDPRTWKCWWPVRQSLPVKRSWLALPQHYRTRSQKGGHLKN